MPNVPDYVATYVQKPIAGRPGGSRTVTQRHGWTRINITADSNDGLISTIYYGPASQYFTIRRQPSGFYEQLLVGPSPAKRPSNQKEKPFKSGERETFAGMQCEIWTIPAIERVSPNRESCVTRDGIELWNRLVGFPSRSYEIASLERKPVATVEVRPPTERFDVNWWLTLPKVAVAPPAEPPRDVTVVMQSEQPVFGHIPRILRRHHPWTYTEVFSATGDRIQRYSRDAERLTISVTRNMAGEATALEIMKWVAKTRGADPEEMNRTESIHGEECKWFNMHPDMADASYIQCRTADGVVLKHMSFSRWGKESTSIAVSLSREPVPLDTVMPPASILAPKTWGIPD